MLVCQPSTHDGQVEKLDSNEVVIDANFWHEKNQIFQVNLSNSILNKFCHNGLHH